MSMVITKTGATERIVVGPIVDTAGAVLTGLTTIKLSVFRASDLKLLDFLDNTFKTSPTTLNVALVDVDTVRVPGMYYYNLDTSLFTNATAKDKYFVYVSQIGATTAANALQSGEMRIGEIVDNVETNLDALVSSRLATIGYTVPPTAAANAIALLDQALSGHTTAGTAGKSLSLVDVASSTLAVPGSAMTLTSGERTTVASTVWSQALPGAFSAGSAGLILGTNLDVLVSSRLATLGYTAPPSAASNATAIWQTLVPGSFTSGMAGFVVGTNLDQTVGSRLATSGYTAPPSAASNATAVWQTLVPGSFTTGMAGFVLGTNLDVLVSSRLATGSYAAPPSAVVVAAAVWDELTSAAAVVNSFGALVKLQLDVAVSSRLASGAYTTPPTAAANAAALLGTAVPAAFSAGTVGFLVGTNLDVLVSSRLATGGYTAPPSAVTVAAAVWDELTSSSGTANSFGALVKLQLDASISTRMATFVYVTPPTVAAISTQVLADLAVAHGAGSWTTATGFSTLTASQVWATVVPGAFASGQAGNVLGSLSGLSAPSAAAISAQVNSDLTALHGAGSYQTATGFSTLTAAQVWATAVPGAFTAGQAGAVLPGIQDDLTAIKGVGWSGETLRHISQTGDGLDSKISKMQQGFGLLNEFNVLVGSSGTVINTDCAYADHTWDGRILLSPDPANPPHSIATRVVTQIAGVFTVSPPLPWIPSDPIIIRADISPASPEDVNNRMDQSDDDFFDYAPKFIEPYLASGDFTSGDDTILVTTITGFGDGFFDGARLMLGLQVDGRTMAEILTYETNGTFTLKTPLRRAPMNSENVYVLMAPSPITTGDLAVETATIIAAVGAAADAVTVAPDGIGVTSFAANSITDTAISALAVDKVQAGLALDATLTSEHAALSSQIDARTITLLAAVAAVAAEVWAVTDGTMTKGEALDLLRRRTTNKRLLSILGVLSFFADDNTTVEKTATLTDYLGGPITLAAGEPARSTAET